MKKVVLLIIIVISFAYGELYADDWGLWDATRSYVVFNNGSSSPTYCLWDNTTGNFQGSDLGTYTSGGTLTITGFDVKTWKSGGNVTGCTYYYVIYETGIRPETPTFTSMGGGWLEDLGSGNQKWGITGASINMLSGLSTGGNYTIEIYGEITGTGTPTGSKYDNNNGNPTNYTATFTYFATNTWSGTTSTDWTTAGNWSVGVPGVYDNVVIPDLSNDPVIASGQNATCNNITMSGAGEYWLTINNGGSLIINGSFTNSGTGGIYISRYLNAGVWHMISSPGVIDISTNGWNPTQTYDDFYAWYEGDILLPWINYGNSTEWPRFTDVNTDNDFRAGKGYLVSSQLGGTRSFSVITSGDLNTGDVPFALAYGSATSGTKSTNWTHISGWNLVGNPYTSSIDWTLVDHSGTSKFQDVFAYVYDDNIDDYEPIDGSADPSTSANYIAPNQGFFVLAKAASTFTFTNAMQVHGGTFLKPLEFSTEKLTLTLSGNDLTAETSIRLKEESTYNRDRFDALKLFSFNADKPQLFTISDDGEWLAINSLPELNEMYTVPLGMRIPADGTYELSITDIPLPFSEIPLYVEDLTDGIWYRIDDRSFSFTETQGDKTDRFLLHFGVTGINDSPAAQPLNAWYANGQLHLAGVDSPATVSLTDLRGRTLWQEEHLNLNLSLNLNLTPGIYLVSVTEAARTRTAKIYIR